MMEWLMMDQNKFIAKYDLKHRMTKEEYERYIDDLDKLIRDEVLKKLMSLGKVIGGEK